MELLVSTLLLLFKAFPLKVFAEVPNSTTVLSMNIFIYMISMIWVFHSTYCLAFFVLLSSTDTG